MDSIEKDHGSHLWRKKNYSPTLGFANLRIVEYSKNLDRQFSDPGNIPPKIVEGKLSSDWSLVPLHVQCGATQFLPLS